MTTQSETSHRIETSVPVADFIAERWSPRSFDESATLPDEVLTSGLEAARLAPSAYNSQPWRFIVGRHGGEVFARVLPHLIPFNQAWASRASALIVNVAVESVEGQDLPTAAYDLGLAVQSLVLQIETAGFVTHQISGIDASALAEEFSLPEGTRAVTVTVVGALGSPDQLDEQTRERETAPRARRPLTELVLQAD